MANYLTQASLPADRMHYCWLLPKHLMRSATTSAKNESKWLKSWQMRCSHQSVGVWQRACVYVCACTCLLLKQACICIFCVFPLSCANDFPGWPKRTWLAGLPEKLLLVQIRYICFLLSDKCTSVYLEGSCEREHSPRRVNTGKIPALHD